MSDELLVREFPVELAEDGDGRTLEARIVPYNTRARVADAPSFEPYEESFLPGAFERQTSAPDRLKIWLNFEHEQGLRGIVGHGIALEEREDALYGTFRVHDNTDGDKALGMVRQGLLTGLSIEFNPLKSKRVDGVVQRLRAHLDKVSLVRIGAYSNAQAWRCVRSPSPSRIQNLPQNLSRRRPDARCWRCGRSPSRSRTSQLPSRRAQRALRGGAGARAHRLRAAAHPGGHAQAVEGRRRSLRGGRVRALLPRLQARRGLGQGAVQLAGSGAGRLAQCQRPGRCCCGAGRRAWRAARGVPGAEGHRRAQVEKAVRNGRRWRLRRR